MPLSVTESQTSHPSVRPHWDSHVMDSDGKLTCLAYETK